MSDFNNLSEEQASGLAKSSHYLLKVHAGQHNFGLEFTEEDQAVTAFRFRGRSTDECSVALLVGENSNPHMESAWSGVWR